MDKCIFLKYLNNRFFYGYLVSLLVGTLVMSTGSYLVYLNTNVNTDSVWFTDEVFISSLFTGIVERAIYTTVTWLGKDYIPIITGLLIVKAVAKFEVTSLASYHWFSLGVVGSLFFGILGGLIVKNGSEIIAKISEYYDEE